jgi:hypothetical protein
MLPVDRAGVEGEWGEVSLAGEGAGKVSGNVPLLGEKYGVSAQLRYDVLPAK